MGFFGTILGFIRRRSIRRDVQRQLDETEARNLENKGVTIYNNAQIEAFIADNGVENILVSGNNQNIKNRVACAAAYNANDNGIPVVVLHCGNRELERLIAQAYNGSPDDYYLINSSNPVYDPLVELDSMQIAQLIVEASTGNNRIGRMGGTYIRGLTEYFTGRNGIDVRPTVKTYIDCPYSEILANIVRHRTGGSLNATDADRITSLIVSGQTEQGSVEQYFRVLNTQAESILADDAENAVSIRKAIDENKTIVIDVVSAANGMLINLAVQEMLDAMSAGKRFLLVADSVPVDSSELFGQLFRNFSNSCNFVYSSRDAYADTQSTANVFETLLARANKVIVMQHNSANSAKKFSEYFGEYERVEINRTLVNGDNYGRYDQVLPGYGNSTVSGMQITSRPRVEEREISALAYDEVFIKRDAQHEVIRVRISDGHAGERYATPRSSFMRNRRRRRRFSWIIFLLLLLIPPAAFIYGIVTCGRTGKIVCAVLLVLVIVFYIFTVVSNL